MLNSRANEHKLATSCTLCVSISLRIMATNLQVLTLYEILPLSHKGLKRNYAIPIKFKNNENVMYVWALEDKHSVPPDQSHNANQGVMVVKGLSG